MKILNYFKARIALVLLSAFVVIVSCTQDLSFNNSTPTQNLLGFNFENSSQTSINLQFRDFNDNPMKGVSLEVYASNPYESNGYNMKSNAKLCMKGITGLDGRFSSVFSFPKNQDSVYVRVLSPSFNKVTILERTSALTKTIYPVGYGAKMNTLRAVGDTDPKLYTRNSLRLPNAADLWVLGNYNLSTGLPNFLLPTNEPIPSDLLSRINQALPEGDGSPSKFLPLNKPQWFVNNGVTNINFIAEAHAWVTFVGEGAGVNNTLAYFYYPTNNPPKTAAEIKKRIVIFPNSSAVGSGGALVPGNTVMLKYYDETTSTWKETFPAGTTVSWYLATNGWMGNSEYGNYMFNNSINQYSLDYLNNGSKDQTIMLYDSEYQRLILGIEDISCTDVDGYGKFASDQDFNDVMYIIRTDPVNAVDLPKFNKLNDLDDNDHDGVPNQNDDYPNDPERAYNNYYPNASTFGSLAFEDNWPNKGDYDFNDLVLDYRIMYVTNAAGAVKDVFPTIRVRAIGAQYRNGFAFEINGDPNNVQSVTEVYAGPGNLLNGSLFSIYSNGCERGQSKIVIPFFDNAYTPFGNVSGYLNTISGTTNIYPLQIAKKITFINPVSVASLGELPYNPFIVVNQERGREVHKPGKSATTLADRSLFLTFEDLTNQTTQWYVGSQNYPWVIDTPIPFDYPAEGNRIESAFLKVNDWILSRGTQYIDWYSNTGAGYRNSNMIYKGK
ncbi:MAG: LruC domain-containing protein [Bacteroidales bacterium]